MFKAETVKGDGNCLFRTLAVFAFEDQEKWKEIKRMIGDFIENDPERFSIAFDSRGSAGFMKQFKKDGYWGGYIEMTAFAFLYNVKLVVHISEEKTRYAIGREDDGREDDDEASVHHMKFEKSHFTPLHDVFFEHLDLNELF